MNKVGIIGVGKLGLCFALNLEKAGYEVYGVDVSAHYVKQLNTKQLISPEPEVSEMLERSQLFFADTQIGWLLNEDVEDIFIMVATPSLPNGTYDHSQIERITEELIAQGKRNNTVHLYVGCTTMPGYCNMLADKLEQYNYTVSYNPEFIAQGSIIHDQQYPDQVLIGEADEQTGARLEEIYRKMVKNTPVFCRMDRLSAEITKLATNCFLTTKISFANSIGDLALKSGADYEKVLNAIGADSRIGSKYLKYGFGFGGPCFPRDNRALDAFAKMQDYPLLISEATDEVNKMHLEFQLQQYLEKYAVGEPVKFDYVSYKRGSVIIEESQQLALAVKLAKAGRKVIVNDRAEVKEEVERKYPGLFDFS